MAPDGSLPPWIETAGIIVWIAAVLWFIIAGKLRLDREVKAAEDRTAEAVTAAEGWRQAYLDEVEARRHAEAAARHIMETDNVVVSLIEALKRGTNQP